MNGALPVDNYWYMSFDPHLAGLFAGSFAGVQKSALEWKRRRHICPSCGRDLRSGCACR